MKLVRHNFKAVCEKVTFWKHKINAVLQKNTFWLHEFNADWESRIKTFFELFFLYTNGFNSAIIC